MFHVFAYVFFVDVVPQDLPVWSITSEFQSMSVKTSVESKERKI